MANPFQLDCADYDVRSASIAHGRDGSVFRCTLSPVTGETLKALNDAVRSKRLIRFAFSDRPLVIVGIEVTRVGPEGIRIAGRVVKTD